MILTRISRSRLLAASTIVAGLAFGADCGLALSDLLCLAPALLLAATLLLRRYPGERLLVALSEARPRGRIRARSSVRSPRLPQARVPRGGLLMAFALAVRPPPAALSAS